MTVAANTKSVLLKTRDHCGYIFLNDEFHRTITELTAENRAKPDVCRTNDVTQTLYTLTERSSSRDH